jgi:hypothetical protein
MTMLPDEDLNASIGHFKRPESIDDISEKIDRLELLLLSTRDRLTGAIGILSIAMFYVAYRLLGS